MKKIKRKILIVLYYIVLFSSLFGKNNDINTIKNLNMRVREINKYSGKNIEKIYNVKFILPDILKKEIIEPSKHKGEIFIYKGGKKITYLPIFDEKIEEEANIDENILSETIKLFQSEYKNNLEFKRDYDLGKKIKIKNRDYEIELDKYLNVSDYKIPTKINIYEDKNIVGEIYIETVKINTSIKKSEFEIK